MPRRRVPRRGQSSQACTPTICFTRIVAADTAWLTYYFRCFPEKKGRQPIRPPAIYANVAIQDGPAVVLVLRDCEGFRYSKPKSVKACPSTAARVIHYSVREQSSHRRWRWRFVLPPFIQKLNPCLRVMVAGCLSCQMYRRISLPASAGSR